MTDSTSVSAFLAVISNVHYAITRALCLKTVLNWKSHYLQKVREGFSRSR